MLLGRVHNFLLPENSALSTSLDSDTLAFKLLISSCLTTRLLEIEICYCTVSVSAISIQLVTITAFHIIVMHARTHGVYYQYSILLFTITLKITIH